MDHTTVHDLKKNYTPKRTIKRQLDTPLISDEELADIFGVEPEAQPTDNRTTITVYNYYLDDHSRTAIEKPEKFVAEHPNKLKMETKLVINYLRLQQLNEKLNHGGLTEKEKEFINKRFDHGGDYTYKVFGIAQECKDLGIDKFPTYLFTIPTAGNKKVAIAGRSVDLTEVATDLKLIRPKK
jgi:hypothetical protein